MMPRKLLKKEVCLPKSGVRGHGGGGGGEMYCPVEVI